jgi:hypothetical protein
MIALIFPYVQLKKNDAEQLSYTYTVRKTIREHLQYTLLLINIICYYEHKTHT